jgi:hypothetical protein
VSDRREGRRGILDADADGRGFAGKVARNKDGGGLGRLEIRRVAGMTEKGNFAGLRFGQGRRARDGHGPVPGGVLAAHEGG